MVQVNGSLPSRLECSRLPLWSELAVAGIRTVIQQMGVLPLALSLSAK